MGIKSDDEILQSLQDHRAARAGDEGPTDSPATGVGETMPDPDEGSDTDDDESEEDDDATESEDEDSEDESGDDAEESDDDDDESEEDDDDADDDEESEDEPDEPDAADKEIARIQEAEKEAKQRINEKLEELKTKEAESADRLAKAEELEAKQTTSSKRMKRAPVAYAKAHGLETHQDFLDLGAKLYKYGKSLAPDAPAELKQWARGIERDGEQDSSVEDLRAQVEALTAARDSEKKQKEEESKTAKEQEEMTGALHSFSDSVVASCSGMYPLAAEVIKNESAENVREGILGLAQKLFQEKGSAPTETNILEEIERQERKRLKRIGLNPDELFPRTKTKAKDKSGSASKKKKAPKKKKTNGRGTGKTKSRVKTDDEILAELSKLKQERQNA